jgi:hypothetical protein
MRAVPTYANTGTVRFRHLWKLCGSLHAWRWIVWALFSSIRYGRDGRTDIRQRYSAGFDFGFEKVWDSKQSMA